MQSIISALKSFFKNPENTILSFLALVIFIGSLFIIPNLAKRIVFWDLLPYRPYLYLAEFIFFVLTIGTIAYFSKKFNLFQITKKMLLVYLPSEIIFLFFNIQNQKISEKLMINNLFKISVSLYLVIGSIYLFLKYKDSISSKEKKMLKKYNFSFSKLRNNFLIFDSKPPHQKLTSKLLGLRTLHFFQFISAIIHKIFWCGGKKIVTALILVIVIAINLGFGSYHLSEFAAVDEALWTYDRIPKFWNNVSDGEFYKTMVSDKPGITVALISGIGLNWINPKDYETISWQGEVRGPSNDIKDLNFTLRLPILIFNALMLLFFYFLLKKLFSRSVAVASVILIGLSPILLGISIIINPDSLLWTLMPLSIISWLINLKTKENKYLYICGIFLGLAILTKYVANILYIFFFALIFLEYILNKEKYASVPVFQYFKKAFFDYLTVIFISLLTFFIFLPAAWVEIGRLFEGTILSKAFLGVWPIFAVIIAIIIFDSAIFKNKYSSRLMIFLSKYDSAIKKLIILAFLVLALGAFANTYLGMQYYDFESILASPKSSYTLTGFSGLMLANFYSLIFGITPIAFLALIFLAVKSLKNIKNSDHINIIYLILFILLYYAASAIENVSATVRYQIIIYPLALILSAVGIVEFLKIINFRSPAAKALVYLLLIIISVYSLNFIRPFYFSYASDLLPNKYVLNLKDMGDGSFEAASYLNKLSGAENLNIWSDKRGVCTFFTGRCHSGNDYKKSEAYFDYFVVSSGRESRTIKMIAPRAINNDELIRFDELYNRNDYVFKLEIGGRPNNFVKIIKAEN